MYTSSFDDETFTIKQAQVLDRSGLIQLQMRVTAEKEAAESQIRTAKSQAWATGQFSDPVWFRQVEASVLRKKQQLRWISARLADLRKERQEKAAVSAPQSGAFYRQFFRLCEEELEERDFRELCEAARQRASSL